MKTKVKIEGLDCPNCALNLEGEINKLDGISNAKIEFVKQALTFESADENKALKEIVTLTKKLEPQAKITAQNASKKVGKVDFIVSATLLVFGIALMIILLIFKSSMQAWLYWVLYVTSALIMGYKTYIKAINLLVHGKINENLLITISVIGASVPGISQHLEGLMVIALYTIGKILEGMAVNKSRKSIENLAMMQPDYAVVLRDGKEEKVAPEAVQIGEVIIVKSGEKVALDGKVTKGSCSIDMQSLTGESLPVMTSVGDAILSGSIVLDGVLEIETTASASESAMGRIKALVEDANEHKSKTETFISRITKWYTLGVVALALLVFGIVWAVTRDVSVAVYRGLTFLVVSCPCAFAISVPLSYFSGLGNASKHGVLIKGSNYLDACAGIKMVAFDKTGTLTAGKFKIEKIVSLDENYLAEDILTLSAIGEQNSLHPLAKAIVNESKCVLGKAEEVTEIAGQGVQFTYGGKTYFVGQKPNDEQDDTQTCVKLYEKDKLIGKIYLCDTIKPTAIETCKELKDMGIKTAILSGDNVQTVQAVAEKVGADIAIGRMSPEEKYAWLKNQTERVGYVGDGLNDAPSLAVSDVGVCMGISGSPASIESADMVIVDDDPLKIITAIKISKYTKKIVWENIAFSAIVKVTFLALGAFGVTGMMWSVFADVGVTLLAILNSLRALNHKVKKS